jgi:NAD(P)-dependent dehydrogenase (short-subunit alcohol dehydrogenase family)
MKTAIVTGGSRGLGLALVRALAAQGWAVITDARDGSALSAAVGGVPGVLAGVLAVAGDVTDPVHQKRLVDEAVALGGLDLLVNNASILGPSPQPVLTDYPLDVLRQVYEVNVVAPLALAQLALPLLRARRGTILNITSDASVEGYQGWGGYGSSKAALDQVSRVLAAEEPDVRVFAVDPGDMRTQMHQEAFPGEDISDRPLPEESVPGLLALIDGSAGAGVAGVAGVRVRVADVAVGVGA